MDGYRLRLDPDSFFDRYWQREHLYVPQGLAGFTPEEDAGELAGLAMEADVDARIVSCHDGRWQQQQGPFSREDFERAGSWTLLVQGVDHYWDGAAALLNAVPCLPDWRVDDIMMSYATDGGSAGPHFDNYDVFIVQGEGQRRWQIGDSCDADSALLEDTDMRLLARFSARHEYLMTKGDVLYVPPGCAHYGVSAGESTSFSIGFRAPRLSDLLARRADNLLSQLADDALFCDAGRGAAARRGEISAWDLAAAREQLFTLLAEDDPRWFGEAVTEGSASGSASNLDDTAQLEDYGSTASRAPGSRLAWCSTGDGLLVFANGQSLNAPRTLLPLLEALCSYEELPLSTAVSMDPAARPVLRWLVDEGALLLHD